MLSLLGSSWGEEVRSEGWEDEGWGCLTPDTRRSLLPLHLPILFKTS